MADNREIFRRLYHGRQYAGAEGDGYFPELIRTRLAELMKLPPGARILDVGCGNGSFLLPLLEAGYVVTGLDCSPPILEELRQRALERGLAPERLHLIAGDACELPFDDASFDAVCSFATLYAVPELDRALAEFARVLVPGGRAHFDLGLRDSLNDLEARRAVDAIEPCHLDADAMLAAIRDAGLVATSARQFQFLPGWGGATPRVRDEIVPVLTSRFSRLRDGRMLDEAVSSSWFARRHAFRWVFEAVRGRATPWTPAPAPGATEIADRRSPERRAEREAAAGLADTAGAAAAATALCELLARDPEDTDTLLALAALLDGPEERALVARYRAEWESEVRRIMRVDPRVAVSPEAPPSADRAPRVSVILPTYNQAAWLPGAIRSVLEQTFEDLELVIVDDGSTDETPRILAELRDPRVRVIHQANARLPRALNRGFAEARGEYLTWTSSDNALAPTMLERLVAALDGRPECGLAACHFSWIDEAGHFLRLTRDQDLSYRSFLVLNPGLAGFLYRADLAREVGPYDPRARGRGGLGHVAAPGRAGAGGAGAGGALPLPHARREHDRAHPGSRRGGEPRGASPWARARARIPRSRASLSGARRRSRAGGDRGGLPRLRGPARALALRPGGARRALPRRGGGAGDGRRGGNFSRPLTAAPGGTKLGRVRREGSRRASRGS
ncbi:MAG: glycosyltransferase [Planctomycetota bacterium]